MPRSFMRQVIDALMPDGAIWQPAVGGDFDKLLDGISETQQAVFDDLGSLEYIRDPYRCPKELLPDLEREFGIAPNNAMTEKDRRASLAVVRYKQRSLATAQKLRRALNLAGFGVGGFGLTVTPNTPATNPYPIFASHDGGYYLVSGDRITIRPLYPQAGNIVARAFDGSDMQSGRESAGFFEETILINLADNYKTPGQQYWPLIFFVGGTVTRDANGRITNVAIVDIPATRRQELHRLILRIKPLGIWAAMMVRYS